METLFSMGSSLILPFWVLMIIVPRWRWTIWLIRQPWIILPPALIYAIAFIPEASTVIPAVLRPEFGPLQTLLGTPSGTVLAWNHMLAFDLFVGRWIYLDAHEQHISAWLTSLCLILVLLVGPIGWMSYGIIRMIMLSRKPQLRKEVA